MHHDVGNRHRLKKAATDICYARSTSSSSYGKIPLSSLGLAPHPQKMRLKNIFKNQSGTEKFFNLSILTLVRILG